jgi:hypothetical protein
MSTELPEPDPTLSSDANDSTYAPAPESKDVQNPPSGPSVEQTLGLPGSGEGPTSKKDKDAKDKAASS